MTRKFPVLPAYPPPHAAGSHDTLDGVARSLPEPKVPDGVDPAAVSKQCLLGNHNRCSGQITDIRPVSEGGTGLLRPCECPVEDCGHSPRAVSQRPAK